MGILGGIGKALGGAVGSLGGMAGGAARAVSGGGGGKAPAKPGGGAMGKMQQMIGSKGRNKTQKKAPSFLSRSQSGGR